MKKNTSIRYPGGRNVLWGIAAYTLGFGLNYIIIAFTRHQFLSQASVSVEGTTYTLAELTKETHIELWKFVGIAFYNSHFVDAIFSGFVGVFGSSGWSTNLITSAGGAYQTFLIFTPLLLIGAGFGATKNALETTELRFMFGTGRTRYFVNGGLMTLFGYVPLVIIGSVLFTANLDGKVVVNIDILKSLVFGGIVYPFVFGGLGGYFRAYVL